MWLSFLLHNNYNYVLLLPGAAGVQVRIDGNSYNWMYWTLTFHPYSNPGKQPLLRLVPSTSVSGNSSAVTVSRLTEGSTDFFWGPIPGELLRQPLDAVTAKAVGADAFPASSTVAGFNGSTGTAALQLLDVVVNSVVSACIPAAGDMRDCDFSYSAAVTPTVSAVNPAALTAGQSLTISGSGFVAGNITAIRVWVGGGPCSVMAATVGELQCTTADNTTAGEHEVCAGCG